MVSGDTQTNIPQDNYLQSSSTMIKGKPYSSVCLQKVKANLRYIAVFLVVLVVSYLGLEFFEITHVNYPGLLSHDRSDVYGVKVLPSSLTDAELNGLPKETFSYIAMIDAGSSGCRAHIYRYGKLGSLLGPLFLLPQHNSKKVKPGLSTFGATPADAGPSLQGLVDFMKSEVPEADWAVTPVFLKATAGLRMLPAENSTAILQSVRRFLSNKDTSPFFFVDSYAQIISGNEEGGFGWIAFNYLKQIIGPRAPAVKPKPYAVIEMGGASAQVSQAAPSAEEARRIPPEYRFSFAIEQDEFHLYTHSYLGFGAEQARVLFDKHASSTAMAAAKEKEKETDMCYNPGYHAGRRHQRHRALDAAEANITALAPAPGADAATTDSALHNAVNAFVSSCLRNMAVLFRSVAASVPRALRRGGATGEHMHQCSHPGPHTFNCVHQPEFVMQSERILTFENFFYVSSALGVRPHSADLPAPTNETTAPTFPLETTPTHIYDATSSFCQLDWATIQQAYPKDGQPKDVNIKACFLGTYAYSFLVDGLKMSPNKVVTIQKEVQNSEIEWALGAAYKEAATFLKRTNLRPT